MWGVLCFIVLFCGNGCIGLMSKGHIGLIKDPLSNIHRRVKRDDKCILKCIKANDATDKNVSPELKLWNKQFKNYFISWPKKEIFQENCVNLSQPYLACLDKCPNSSSKMMIQNSASMQKLLCVDQFDELNKDYQCLLMAKEIIINRCSCIHHYKDENDFDETCAYNRLFKNLDTHCQYRKCMRPCETRLINEFCGQNLTKLLVNDIDGVSLRSNKIQLLMDNKYKSLWPSECTALLQETGHDVDVNSVQVQDDFSLCCGQFPDEEHALKRMQRTFYELNEANFPHVVDAIDGTHVRISPKAAEEGAYVNRKGFHSINVQAVCDSNGEFTNVVACLCGSTHDSFILKQSNIWAAFKQ